MVPGETKSGVWIKIRLMKGRLRSKRYLNRVSLEFLSGIGEVEGEDFEPSPFQRDALHALAEGRDVIVSAPTGSGKTWIAERAIEGLLGKGERCWYTTPLKALSNQKYDNFRDIFGEKRVGLLTGERRENPSAPLIVATTEVLRNALYEGGEVPSFIVLDEAHYLGDEERGTTWEEVIILAPPESQLLLLSATISNTQEIASWMGRVRSKRPHLITSTERPVPLRYGFISRKRILPLWPKLIRSLASQGLRRFNPVKMVEVLEQAQLLPAIVFLSRRKDCDLSAQRFYGLRSRGEEERRRVFEEVIRDNPHLWDHTLLRPLIEAGVGSHHAGHITAWKIAVERMLAKGLLRAVFATTTLAAGLDVPARTVVLPGLLGRDGARGQPLSALEFQQMTGRAGRRGKDRVGFVIIVPRNPKELFEAVELASRKPEPLRSSFRLQYYQVLNLLARMDLQEALEFLKKSFLLHQLGRRRRERVLSRLSEEFRQRADLLRELGYLDEGLRPTDIGKWGLMIRHERSLLLTELIKRRLYPPIPSLLAAWVGSMGEERAPQRALGRVDLRPLSQLAMEISAREREKGLTPSGMSDPFLQVSDIPSEACRRASLIKTWAEGADWRQLILFSGTEEGDLQRMVLQTGEILRQIEDLPLEISEIASLARRLILRPPVQ